MNKEIWIKIPNFENRYEVSNLGKVRSLDGRQKGKILKPINKGRGYRQICLYKTNTNRKLHRVHRLVAQAFIPNPENKPYINHIDNNPSNNCVSNLEWATPLENYNHSKKQNRNAKGETSGTSKLTDKDVLEIREIYKNQKPTYKHLGKMFNVSDTTAFHIVHRFSWKHI